jgi:hypothetical protein
MALIRFPAGEQRSGSTGGVVYSHNRAGAYIRARSVPVNPNTTRQSTIRGYLAALSNAWYSILTQSQRNEWDQYAANVPVFGKLGQTFYLTGQQTYVKLNTPRLQSGLPVVTVAPVDYQDAPGFVNFSATASGATQFVTVSWGGWTTWENLDDAGMLVSLGIPQIASRKFFNGPWRYNDVVLGDAAVPASSPAVLGTTPWVIQEGQRLWVKARISMPDGRLGVPATYDFLCSA